MTGLVQKFKVEQNEEPFPAHDGETFVLYPRRDTAALQALYVYAACRAHDDITLAGEIKSWLDSISIDKMKPFDAKPPSSATTLLKKP